MKSGGRNRHNRTCRKKGGFKTLEEAEKWADDYNFKHPMSQMRAYYCGRHSRYHAGHGDWAERRQRTDELLARRVNEHRG